VAHVTHVSVVHIPGEPTVAIETAPRKMVLWGMVDGADNLAKYHALRRNATGVLADLMATLAAPAIHHDLIFLPLVSFDYSIHAPGHVQTFPLLPSVVNANMDFGVVVLEIMGNWGSSTTCLHGTRVLGVRVVDE
jgi:hypothetical protein